MKSVAFCTLGCKVNQYETECLREMFLKAGYCEADFDSYADVYIINTCTVTSISDRKSRQMIRRAKRNNPDAYIVVCGCYAQTAPEKVAEIDGVDLIIGSHDKSKILEYVNLHKEECAVCDIMHNHHFEKMSSSEQSHRSRAYVKIQDGCSQFCSYCIIPYARGPIRSRPVNEILEESKILAEKGFSELVYVGIHVASYGLDTKETDLAGLLCLANEITDIKRIRLSSIEPMTLNADFCKKISKCDKLCRHFHLSLQSGCDDTLKRMNRRYTTSQYKEIVDGLRKNFPECAITTDIMVGFPGETDEEFNASYEFVKNIEFSDAHIFKYSRRRGTPADKMPNQISPEKKDLRSKQMIEICKKTRDKYLDTFTGKTLEVLFEEKNGEFWQGKTTNYITVLVKANLELEGSYQDVLIKNHVDGVAFGDLV